MKYTGIQKETDYTENRYQFKNIYIKIKNITDLRLRTPLVDEGAPLSILNYQTMLERNHFELGIKSTLLNFYLLKKKKTNSLDISILLTAFFPHQHKYKTTSSLFYPVEKTVSS